MAYDYGHPQYLAAREAALARSGRVCQFCGQKPAAETHHWAERYPPTRKRGSNRTATDDARLRELECQGSLYLDARGAPTIPEAAFRSSIETAARRLKQGPQVREGLIVTEVVSFDYDRDATGQRRTSWARAPNSPFR